jgi:predicted regulator of amino acid metabolism with ACT domain
MWRRILERFSSYPARVKVAKTIIELGFRISKDGKIYCGPVEQSFQKIARALNVDRRVVKETVISILRDPDLKEIFTSLKPSGPLLSEVAKQLGFSVIEIYADSEKPGILAKAASIIASENISIRQAVAEDPDLSPEPKLILVLEKPTSGEALKKILEIEGVKKISVY